MKKIFSFLLIFSFFINSFQVFASDGNKTIYIFVKDEAGNIQAVPATDQITLDTVLPVINITVNPDNTQAQGKVVRATISDINLDTIKYIQIPSGTTCNGLLTFENDYVSGDNIVLSSEDDNGSKICFRAKDKANNYSYLASNTIENIDRTAPSIAITYKDGDDNNIGATDATTTRKVGATISDITTGSSNFGDPSLFISSTLTSGTYSSSGECSEADFSPYTTERIFSDPVSDNGKQLCFKGEDDAGNISYELVTVVLNAIPTFISVSKNSAYINSQNLSNVSFTVNGILDNDNDDVDILYSWDGTTFTILDTVVGTNVVDNYGPFSLDATSRSEGNNTLYIKLNDGNNDSAIKTVSIFKDSILPSISINNISNTDPEQVKYMSGTISDTNSFSGFITIVDSGEVCSEQTYTISYIPGQDITLNTEDYNDKKVCFKAVDEFNNTSYSSSSVISGIDRTAPVIPTNVSINGGDSFTNNNTVNIEITHPDEGDVYEWCITEDNDYNTCTWSTEKPSTYDFEE